MLFYFYYFKRVWQIAAHCQKNLDLAVAAKESGEIVNYGGGGGGGGGVGEKGYFVFIQVSVV